MIFMVFDAKMEDKIDDTCVNTELKLEVDCEKNNENKITKKNINECKTDELFCDNITIKNIVNQILNKIAEQKKRTHDSLKMLEELKAMLVELKQEKNENNISIGAKKCLDVDNDCIKHDNKDRDDIDDVEKGLDSRDYNAKNNINNVSDGEVTEDIKQIDNFHEKSMFDC